MASFTFIKEHIIVILLIVGAVVPFVLSVYEKLAEKKKIRVMLILLSTGFIITLCIIIISDIQKQSSKELEKKKNEMIKSISANVSKNVEMSIETLKGLKEVQSTLESLKGISLERVGVALTDKFNYDNMHVFEKGDPSMIPEYVSWLEAVLQRPGEEPAIAVTVNAGKDYRVGLILAYLLANEANVDTIMASLGSRSVAWEEFPNAQLMRSIREIRPEVKYVLFYNRNRNHLLGFADASLFARELLLYKTQGGATNIESILNQQNGTSAEIMKSKFSSFNPTIFDASDAYEAADQLIAEEANEGISFHERKPWLVSLARIIKLE